MSDQRSPRPPAVGRLLEREEISSFFPLLSRPLVTKTVRDEVDFARARVMGEGALQRSVAILEEERLVPALVARLSLLARRRLRRVLNGTGILLHTNLGRSPIDKEEWEAAASANEGYSNLELDLESGQRGRRGGLVEELAAELAGSEAAIVLNNNAAALLLALKSLAAGREVVVSRGEQVQIGGGFRIPDILALSGARLVEVGTTNVTTVEDYLGAIGPATACVLVVHNSNFIIRGFASKPRLAELAAALPEGLPLVVDQGSGCVEDGVPGEETVSRQVRDGADLVCFSGDKLLGGPQAGIAAGRAKLVVAMGRDPLARALRPGKTVLSLLETRLVRVLNGEGGVRPDPAALESYGQSIRRRLPKGSVKLLPSLAALGGGSSPDETFPSQALELDEELVAAAGGAVRAAALLRSGEPPLVATIREGRLVVDLAGLFREDPALVAGLLRAVLAPPSE